MFGFSFYGISTIVGYLMPNPFHKYKQFYFKQFSLLYSHIIHMQLYTYTCRNKINNNDERTHFFRKIYLSHFIWNGWKGLCVRGELETEHTTTYWPQVPLSLAALLSRSDGLFNRGSWGPSPLWELVLPTASYLHLTQPLCGTGLYNCLTSTCFLWTSHMHPIQPIHSQGYTLISSTGCTCYLHRCTSYLTARPRSICNKFSISTLFSLIWPINRTLSGATTLDQSRLGSDDNE